MKDTTKLLTESELILTVVEGKIKIVKNRNMIKRSQLIEMLDTL